MESLTVITLILRLVGVVVMVDVTNVTGFVVLELAAADDWPTTPPGLHW